MSFFIEFIHLAKYSTTKHLFKNNIPSSANDEGVEGYGIVVFEKVTTIPYPTDGGRWNIVTITDF
ncbi:MAG: hypothetical protein A2W93_11020 [Bacteroidetes bacterium GWF2_43_63]|nr:MAG: hypothetical protein A2W94_13895 [Bacteroidetes bacterium GWE2_42_42]OFY54808.1 MAG: hypothetical protein A2W93_11020 [Bacteroidetes bacterium GWF2_43_63]HCB63293.1 hypothetical protein [Bacteroidales bacterium]HCY22035.1 hypothetical protein [Bacteroidales bacterium]